MTHSVRRATSLESDEGGDKAHSSNSEGTDTLSPERSKFLLYE